MSESKRIKGRPSVSSLQDGYTMLTVNREADLSHLIAMHPDRDWGAIAFIGQHILPIISEEVEKHYPGLPDKDREYVYNIVGATMGMTTCLWSQHS